MSAKMQSSNPRYHTGGIEEVCRNISGKVSNVVKVITLQRTSTIGLQKSIVLFTYGK